jgi:MFS family permease
MKLAILEDWQEINVTGKRYLLARFLLAGFFTWPFWYGFAIEHITPANFGLYIAVSYIVSMAAEVPTGAFADKFGRKRSALVGIMLAAIYGFVVFFGRDFEFYIISAVLSGVGSAFVSGSLEALVFESAGMTKAIFRKVSVLESLFWQSGLIIATATGGFLYEVNRFLPFAAQGVSFTLAFLVVLGLVEQTVSGNSANQHVGYREFISQNVEGFAHLFDEKVIRPLLVFGAVLAGVVWVGVENLNEAAMIHYGYQPEARGLILSATKLLAVIILIYVLLKKLKSDTAKVICLYCLLVLAFALYSFDNKLIFFAGFLLFNLTSSTMDNFIRPILHDNIQNKFRATAISTYSLLTNVIVAGLSMVVGVALKQLSPVVIQRYLLAVVAIVCGVSLVMFLRRLTARPR